MPEASYTLLFALLTWSVVVIAPSRVYAGALLAGGLVGTMLLVKPHAIAMFLGVLATFGTFSIAPAPLRPRLRMVLTGMAFFVLSTYVTLVCVNGILTGRLALHPFAFVGDIYRPYLDQGLSASSWFGRTPTFFTVLAGHAIVFGALLAPAAAVAATSLYRLYGNEPGAPASDSERRKKLFALIVFAAFAALFTIAMTVNFTVQAEQTSPAEHVRLHGRYYSFVIPLCLTVYFVLMFDRRDAGWLRWGALVGCLSAVLLYYLLGKRIIYPFDYPEAFVFSSWHDRPRAGILGHISAWSAHVGIAAAIVTYALMLWRGRAVMFLYPVLLIALFILSNLGVTGWQRANSVANAALRADARALKQCFQPAERNDGLVVGPEWNGPLAYFLFSLGSSARVLVRSTGSVVTDTDVPHGTRWVVLIGTYQAAFRSTPMVETPGFTCRRVDAGENAAVPR
jgi:hypothetical protein